MLVSVIVVVYNSSKTVLETLESIKNQTYKNIELVITDDASSDNTIEIVTEWGEKNRNYFNNFLVLKTEKNTGVSANVARGIQASKGEYYKDIAGDDLLEPTAIEMFVDTVNNTRDKIIYQAKNRTFYQTEEDKKFVSDTDDMNERNIQFLKLSQKSQYRTLLESNLLSAPAMGLIPRKIYDEINGIDKKYEMIEDYPMWIKLSELGYSFRLIDEYLVDYRISETSISHGKSKLYINNEIDIFFKERAPRLLKEKMYFVYLKGLTRYGIKKYLIKYKK